MKKLLMILAVSAAVASCAKERINDSSTSASTTSSSSTSGIEDKTATPPPAVLNAFKARFGNVPVTQWKLRSDGTWRAHFTRNGVAWEATFRADGTLIKSEAA